MKSNKNYLAGKLKRGVRLEIGEKDGLPCIYFPEEFNEVLPVNADAIATMPTTKEIRLKIVRPIFDVPKKERCHCRFCNGNATRREAKLVTAKIEKISKEMDEGKRKTIPLDAVLKKAGIKRSQLK